MEYIYDSKEFKESSLYKNFININQGVGILKIEASTASGAYPLKDVDIVISKDFGEDKIIFYKGITNDSGIIDNIILPTRSTVKEIMEASDIIYTTYDLVASYPKYNLDRKYDVSIFDDIKVIQPIVFSIDNLIEGEDSDRKS